MADPVSWLIIAAKTAIGAAKVFVAKLTFAKGVAAGLKAWATAAMVVSTVASVVMAPKVQAAEGGPISLKLDQNAPIPIVFGRTATGGYCVYREGFGPKNQWLGIISVLSAGPVQQIEQFLANNTPVTFDAANEAAGGTWNRQMRMYYRDGSDPETAFDVSPPFPAELPGVTTAHKATGYAKACWVLNFDPNVYSTGVPAPLWIVRGVRCYDPRLDSTYPGGSGPQRRNDESTWTYTENPYLHGLAWTMGRFRAGRRVWGIGAPWEMIDVAAFVEGANVADVNAWKGGGVVTTDDSKWEVLSALLQAGGGFPIPRAGQISCRVWTPRVAVDTITERDLAGAVSLQTTQTRRARFNRAIPHYRSEGHNWEVVTGSAIENATYLTEDRSEPRTREVKLPMVQTVGQASQLAAYMVADSREGRTLTVPVRPAKANARVGEVVNLSLTDGADLIASGKFLVLAREYEPETATFTYTLRSETDSKHAWALAQTGTAPPLPSLPAFDPTQPAAPNSGQWTATNTSLTSSTGGSVPAILVTGSASDDLNAATVVVRYKVSTSSTWTLAPEVPATTTRIEITGVTSGTTYNVEIAYRTARGALSAWRALSNVSIPARAIISDTIAGVSDPAFLTAPGANLFPYPRPLNTTLAPNAYGWNSANLQAVASPQNGGDVYYRARNTGGAAVTEFHFLAVPITAAANRPYTVSLNGFSTGGTFAPYVELLNAGGSAVASAAMTQRADGRWSATVTNNVSATQIRVVVQTSYPSSGLYQDTAFWAIKVEASAEMTPYAEDAARRWPADRNLYSTAQSVEVLRPAEALANVTEARTAAAIAGQGSLATANRAVQLFDTSATDLLTITNTLALTTVLQIGFTLPEAADVFVQGSVTYRNINAATSELWLGMDVDSDLNGVADNTYSKPNSTAGTFNGVDLIRGVKPFLFTVVSDGGRCYPCAVGGRWTSVPAGSHTVTLAGYAGGSPGACRAEDRTLIVMARYR